MVIKRLRLGEAPRLEISRCEGDLEVRGLPRQDVVLESDTPSFQVTTTEETAIVSKLEGNCAIHMPERGHLHIGSVSGQMKLKGVLGKTEIEHLDGDCIARYIGSLTIGHIGGDLHLRHADTAINLGTIGGSATLHDIHAPITIAHVGGGFWGRNLPAGLRIEGVDCDLALHTDFAPGSSFWLAITGHVLFRIPSHANVRFRIPAPVAIEVDEDLKIMTEGEHKIIMLGTGAAEVYVGAAASVRVRSDETCDMEGEHTFPLGGNIDAYMTDVSAQIDAQMSQIEARLNDLPDRVRYRIERKLEAAQRKVESALRDAGQAGENAQHAHCSQTVYAPTHEPVSEAERLVVLRMLEKGTITVQEAENLLVALEKGG